MHVQHAVSAAVSPQLSELAPGVSCLALRTCTLPPATTTNTLFVGHSRFVVIEPATGFAEQQARLCAEIEYRQARGQTFAGILLTHHHVDHIGSVDLLRYRYDVPVFAHAETAVRVDFYVDEVVRDNQVIAVDEHHSLLAMHTPGHAPGHLVYFDASSRIAYVGDMLAGEGTVIIDPDDRGCMSDYLDSLHRLARWCVADDAPLRFVPSHGRVIEQPRELVAQYIEHRIGRERLILEVMSRGSMDLEQILALAYADKPRTIWPAARKALRAHLGKLIAEGRVQQVGLHYRLRHCS